MAAIVVFGGEDLVPRARTLRKIRKAGQILGSQNLVIRLGPLRGVIVLAFVQGLLGSERRATIKLRVPEGQRVEPRLLELVQSYGSGKWDLDTVYPDYGQRTDNLLRDSLDAVIVLPGDFHTRDELHRALDITPPVKRIIVFDGEGMVARDLKEVPRYFSRAEIIGAFEDPEPFLKGIGEEATIAQGC